MYFEVPVYRSLLQGDMLEAPFGKVLPLLVFGVSSMVAGLSALILPETGNTKLPDTIQDTVIDISR